MELIISIFAIIISIVSIVVSVIIYYKGVEREQKQATLDAFNVLQEQVFDNLNQYKVSEIKNICLLWKQAISKNRSKKELTEDEEKAIDEYRLLSGYLARIEHFALGVNTDIYDAKIAERAATAYLVSLYRQKLKPLIELKHVGNKDIEYYAEFRKLVEKIEKIK